MECRASLCNHTWNFAKSRRSLRSSRGRSACSQIIPKTTALMKPNEKTVASTFNRIDNSNSASYSGAWPDT